jgi:hypothetical protein
MTYPLTIGTYVKVPALTGSKTLLVKLTREPVISADGRFVVLVGYRSYLSSGCQSDEPKVYTARLADVKAVGR